MGMPMERNSLWAMDDCCTWGLRTSAMDIHGYADLCHFGLGDSIL